MLVPLLAFMLAVADSAPRASAPDTLAPDTLSHARPRAVVQLEEGPRMMSRVVGLPPSEVKIGMKVQAKVVKENGESIVVFEKVG